MTTASCAPTTSTTGGGGGSGTPSSSPLLSEGPKAHHSDSFVIDVRDQQPSALAPSKSVKVFELCTTFIAVVCLWGAIDDVVELLAGDSLTLGVWCYLSVAGAAMVGQKICNSLFSTTISLRHGLSQF